VLNQAYAVLRELPLNVIAPVVLMFGFGYSGSAIKDIRKGGK